ncbi:MAG: HNH endonuclease [Bacteroidetes bacterium]|nr:HNH endonuclease [Bacteroidota bacterium]
MNLLQHLDFPTLAKEFYLHLNQRQGNSKTIKAKVEDLVNAANFGQRLQPEQDFINFLNNDAHLEQLITANPDQLDSLRQVHGTQLFWDNNAGKSTPFGIEVLKIFDYEGFRTSKKAKWLADKLKIKTCLYCNAQYTVSTGMRIYHTFDHFFSKKRYPYLSLSFYNLIPACDNCNRIKSDIDIVLATFRHPYFGVPLMNEFQFGLEPSGVVQFHTSHFREEQYLTITINTNGNQTAETHKRMFNLEDQYSVHKDITAELVWKSVIYNPNFKSDLKKLLRTVGIDDKELDRIILGNYPASEDFHKRPLAKLMNDIAKDLKLV